MKSLYFECTAGISGDMAVAAMLDAGADENVLRHTLDTIPVKGFSVQITRVKKAGIDCCDFNVVLDKNHENHDHDMNWLFGNEAHCETLLSHEHHTEERGNHHHEHEHNHEHEHHHTHEHRGVSEIAEIIDSTDMTEKARSVAKKILSVLAQGESEAHGIPVEQVHFHEVGALDSIVDIIALAVCFDNLNVSNVYIPKLFEGTGTIRCQHGILPVPVPAVANIARLYSLPVSLSQEKGEFITPTGAAFAAAVRTAGNLPETVEILAVGLGAGKRTYSRPSILRAFIIEETDFAETEKDTVIQLETNIDDCTGEALGFTLEQLFSAGALEAHFVPCFMKKNRPAYILTVLCEREKTAEMEQIIFAHTSAIGIRQCEMKRTKLCRETVSVKTPLGYAYVKKVSFNGETRIFPEYESVAKLSRETGIPFGKVYKIVAESANFAVRNCNDDCGQKSCK